MGMGIWTKVSGIISSVRVAEGEVDAGAGEAVSWMGAGAVVEGAAIAPAITSAEQEIDVI